MIDTISAQFWAQRYTDSNGMSNTKFFSHFGRDSYDRKENKIRDHIFDSSSDLFPLQAGAGRADAHVFRDLGVNTARISLPQSLFTMETYYGHIRTPADAIKIFEACRLGILQRVRRRLSEKERQAIKSGSVFVWDEREAGMRRWTDGKSWSASRVSGSFLTYREMEGKRGAQFFLPLTPTRQSSNIISDTARASDEDLDEEGPEGYRYKPDGLMKQSFSIKTSAGKHLHLISYYSRSHTNIMELPQPTSDPQLRHIVPVKGMYPESTLHDSHAPALTYPISEPALYSTTPNTGQPLQYCNKTSSPKTIPGPICHQYSQTPSYHPWPSSPMSAQLYPCFPINAHSPSSLSHSSTTQSAPYQPPMVNISPPTHPSQNCDGFDNSLLPISDSHLLTPLTNDRSCNASPQVLHSLLSHTTSGFSPMMDPRRSGNMIYTTKDNQTSPTQSLNRSPSTLPAHMGINSNTYHNISPEIAVVSSMVPSISSLVEVTDTFSSDYLNNSEATGNISDKQWKRSLLNSRNQEKVKKLHDVKVNSCEDQRAIRVLDRKFCV